jgi:hypothetical protein
MIKIKLYEPKELLNLLTTIGFKGITPIKAFDRNKQPDQEDAVMVYERRK